jgi:two-component system response regulator AtoC
MTRAASRDIERKMAPQATRIAQIRGSALVVDGDTLSAASLCRMLVAAGLTADHVVGATKALAELESKPFDLVISEQRLADATGIELLRRIVSRWPEVPVVLVASDASVQQAVEAVKAGALDFLQKPYEREEILLVVDKALASANARLEHPPPPSDDSGLIFGDSPPMRDAMSVLKRASPGNATVLIRGESGTGKELVARALHKRSPRADAPFVKIDCASLPETLLESELFGYEKGAFTGAVGRKPGRVELADGGTLFLDEIGELTASLQAKLLRLLQDREFERLGGTKTVKVDVRVVSATHRDLEAMVERGQFRQDLFYRLNVVPLWLPPLRARRGDVELLARHFCKVFGDENGKHGTELEPNAVRALRGQRWPGNVRQLQNFMERLVVLTEGPTITEHAVRAELSRQVSFATQPGTDATSRRRPPTSSIVSAPAAHNVVGPLDVEMRAAEKKVIERALRHARGNRSLAARLLGVSRSTLYAKLEEHGLL